MKFTVTRSKETVKTGLTLKDVEKADIGTVFVWYEGKDYSVYGIRCSERTDQDLPIVILFGAGVELAPGDVLLSNKNLSKARVFGTVDELNIKVI